MRCVGAINDQALLLANLPLACELAKYCSQGKWAYYNISDKTGHISKPTKIFYSVRLVRQMAFLMCSMFPKYGSKICYIIFFSM